MRVLVTGHAGFIGMHMCDTLLDSGHEVTGIDSHNSYYDPRLKAAREARLTARPGFRAVHGTIETPGLLAELMARFRPDAVVHLAAQAGVRHSIDHPRDYVAANLQGTFELLEAARAHPPAHLLLASSSSVYGASPETPWSETARTAAPLSFYAATKLATEQMAHSYAHLYGLPVTMLRFFTVYGPWWRPDMAPALFTTAVLEGRPIRVFNHGDMRRDFTYVGDVVEALRRLLDLGPPSPGAGVRPLAGDSLSPVAPFRILNIGQGSPVALMDFIAAIEAATGRAAIMDMQPMQPGDVPATWADGRLLQALTGMKPATPLAEGVAACVAWYRDFAGA